MELNKTSKANYDYVIASLREAIYCHRRTLRGFATARNDMWAKVNALRELVLD